MVFEGQSNLGAERVLLINPPYSEQIYKDSMVRVGIPHNPVASLPTLAASLKKEGIGVKIVDLNLSKYPWRDLVAIIGEFRPQMVGTTFTTPLFEQAKEICKIVKQTNPTIQTVVGGPHVSALPEETLSNGPVDVGIIGEGDFNFVQVVLGNDKAKINGIAYKGYQRMLLSCAFTGILGHQKS